MSVIILVVSSWKFYSAFFFSFDSNSFLQGPLEFPPCMWNLAVSYRWEWSWNINLEAAPTCDSFLFRIILSATVSAAVSALCHIKPVCLELSTWVVYHHNVEWLKGKLHKIAHMIFFLQTSDGLKFLPTFWNSLVPTNSMFYNFLEFKIFIFGGFECSNNFTCAVSWVQR